MINNNIKYLEKLFSDIEPDLQEDKGLQPLKPIETHTEKEYEPNLKYESKQAVEDKSSAQDEIRKQGRVDSLIWAFRDIGSIYAQLNPLGNDYQEHYTNLPLIRKGIFEKLTPEDFDLSQDDLDKSFYGGPVFNYEKRTLKEILEVYSRIYCSSVGIEFLHIQNKLVRKWFIQNLENERSKYQLSMNEKIIILEDLIKSEEMELFLNKNYIGQKRFSIEGADTVIPCLSFYSKSCRRVEN